MKRTSVALAVGTTVLGLVLATATASAFGVSGGGGRVGYLDPESSDGGIALGAHLELEKPGSHWHLQPNILYWNADRLTGFNAGSDVVQLSRAGLGLGSGGVVSVGANSAWNIGTNAVFVFESDSSNNDVLSGDDFGPNGPSRGMLAHDYWQNRFGGDAGVIGRNVTVNGVPAEIVGVMPPGFRVLDAAPGLIVPMRFDRAQAIANGAPFCCRGIARLKTGTTIEQANDFEDLELTEYGAEVIAVVVPRAGEGAGLGFVAEFEAPFEGEDTSALVLGPIVEFESGPWFAAAVPMVVYAFGGEAENGDEIDDKWDFAYAAQVMYTFSPAWALALEGYGTVERIGNTGAPSESAQLFGDFNQHRLGPVLYFTTPLDGFSSGSSLPNADAGGTSLNIGLGLLAGLNADTPDLTLKLSIEVEF